MLKDDMIDLHFGGRAFERDRGTVQGGSSKQSNRTLRYFEKGVSENSVPLNPMVLLIIIPTKWLFHWEY